MITIDSREKPDKITHITGYFDAIGQPYIRSKLYSGDYTLTQSQAVVIDRKQHLLELAGNLGKQHDRFRREIFRAHEIGAKFVVLIEEDTSLDRVTEWADKKSQVSGKMLARIMETVAEKYGVEWVFCKKADAPKQIIKILKGV
jgi:hypothetical protein